MSKFKVGDRVRAIPGKEVMDPYYTINPGEHTVTDMVPYSLGGPNVALTGHKRGACFCPSRLELVSEAKSELEQLVETANAGLEATATIRQKYLDQVERIAENDPSWKLMSNVKFNFAKQYRIKPKPVFTPYKMKDEGYEVVLVELGTMIKIGCAAFEIKELQAALRALVINSESSYFMNRGEGYLASKTGIQHERGKISWASAEELYEKIKDL